MAADDMYAAEGEKIEAFDTVYIWWEDQWHELHLTAGHIAMLEKALRPYLDAARKSKGPARAVPKEQAKQRRRGKDRSPRKDWGGFKAWCDSTGRVYRSPAGGFYPRPADIAAYEQWLSDHPASAPQDSAHPAA